MHRVRYNSKSIELLKYVPVWDVKVVKCIPQLNVILMQNKLSNHSLLHIMYGETILLNSIQFN